MLFDVAMAKKTADTIRVLSAEAIQKAKSGHPGMPLGCADYAAVLWSKYLRHDPSTPGWLGRDRFILSAGHGSMLISVCCIFSITVWIWKNLKISVSGAV